MYFTAITRCVDQSAANDTNGSYTRGSYAADVYSTDGVCSIERTTGNGHLDNQSGGYYGNRGNNNHHRPYGSGTLYLYRDECSGMYFTGICTGGDQSYTNG